MTRVRSREECIAAIQADAAWRKKEVAWLSGLLDNRDPPEEAPLRRSTMVMIYAHWEGFVRTASELYFSHINEVLKRTAPKLSGHFESLRMWKMLRQQGEHEVVRNAIPFLRMREGWPCDASEALPLEVVDTASNLNAGVLRRLCHTVDVPFEEFATKENLIDERLLDARNAIAHGERRMVSYKDLMEAHSEILNLIELYQKHIEDRVDKRLYLAA